MSETQANEAPFTVTLKGGRDFHHPWLVIRGETAVEVVARLAEAGMEGLLDRVAEYSNAFQNRFGAAAQTPLAQGSANANSAGSPPSSSQGQQSAPQNTSSGGAAAPSNNNRANVQTHPEGKTCAQVSDEVDRCNEVLVFKTTGGGKKKWQCPQWRWNNGNPNGHGVEWVN